MNDFNKVPIIHGFNLEELQALIGNQVIYIGRLTIEIESLKIELNRLKEELNKK